MPGRTSYAQRDLRVILCACTVAILTVDCTIEKSKLLTSTDANSGGVYSESLGGSSAKTSSARGGTSSTTTAGSAGESTGGTVGEGGASDDESGGSTAQTSTVDPDVVVDALDSSLITMIDERPIGGASLNGGTSGGGDYATAFAAARIYLVDTIDELTNRVTNDDPAVVLVAAGTYAFVAASETSRSVCAQACSPTTPIASQNIISGYCTSGESTFTVTTDFATLKVGSNKTIIGLGTGANLTNVEVQLSNSSNLILRNLSINNVSPSIARVGYGLKLWPTDHVWLDHLTLSNIGQAFVQIVSDYDGDTQVVTTETGYITITNSDFNGYVSGLCGQRSPFIIGTHRTPAITLARNWFRASHNLNPYLFGPGTWAHLFNNLYTDIDSIGVAIACGAQGFLQGNVFESVSCPLYNNDDGVGTWLFCATDYYGSLYAPMGTGDDEENLYDSGTNSLNGQSTDGTGMTPPVRQSGNQFSVAVPVGSGTESYLFTLESDPSNVSALVQASAGVGKLF